MISRIRGIAALALALTLPMAACDDATDTELGSVTVQLTDAPGEEVDTAWVTITDIYLQSESGDDDAPGSRVYLLEDGEETHELLSLSNAVENLVVGQDVPTGTYGQLRMVISGGCLVTDSGSVYTSSPDYDLCGDATGTLQMPSFAQSGVKVQLNGLTIEGGQQVLLLDFDVEDSFGRQAGNSGRWVMTPVIHASNIGLTAGVLATLSADVGTLPAGFELGQFSATLDPTGTDSTRVPFTDDDGDGTFEAEFLFLIPSTGPFELRLNVPDGLTADVTPDSPQSLSPASGETEEVNWVVDSAEETQ